jgi:hypothetical protein
VSALKQHAFFDGIDWNALNRKEIAPPIDLTSLQQPQPQQKGGKDAPAAAPDANGAPTLTCFAAEFTDQHISLSMIEETASTACASPASPRSRSKLEDGAGPEEVRRICSISYYFYACMYVCMVCSYSMGSFLYMTSVSIHQRICTQIFFH